MNPPGVGNVIARGGQTAHTMSQESAAGGGTSVFDVWTHSYDGLAGGMQSASQNPAAFLAGDPAQFARAQTAAMNMPAASANQIESSMSAQAGALGESVKAVSEAQGALQTVGATFALLTGVEQMLSSVLSAIPFPALPAVRIADFDIGLPHAHSHPPNLIPPAPPIPLPSMGPVIPIPILSGAANTLVNGMPAGRCGDMGLGIWCGGYFPLYEVFLGSSSVWIEGARAARVLVDITRHCMFTMPKPSDPPLGPMIGTTISCSPNVLIGGVPMPSLTALAFGAAMKGALKLAGKGARAFARSTAPLRRRLADALGLEGGFLKCNVLRAEPVNFITGEVYVQQEDYSIPGLIALQWQRYYTSHSLRRGACGYGWSTPADARLVIEDDGAVLFHNGCGSTRIFSHLPAEGSVQGFIDGATLEVSDDTLRVRIKDELTYVFRRSRAPANELFVQQLEDRFGSSLRYVRDEHGLREIVESAGRRIEVKSSGGLVQEMWLRYAEHEPAHLLVRYEYSESGELLAACDALDQPCRFRYEHRRLVQHTDRNGLSFRYAYDSEQQSARCHHAWGDGRLYDYRFAFDASARRVTITDSLDAVFTVQLDERNLPIWEIDGLGGITKYEYDECGRTIGVTNPDGQRTAYEYDARGNLLELTRPDGTSVMATFNADNRPVAVKDASGSLWQNNWDSRGLLIEQITPLGHISRYEYDAQGQLVAFTNPRGARTELGFDAFGNLTRIRDALGRRTRFGYDARGNLTGKLDALERKSLYQYDANNRLEDVRLPSGASIHYDYDAQGNVIRHTDENGGVTQFEYFGQGEVARRIQPDGSSVRFHYDTEERLIGVTNQRGQLYQLKRDALGRITEEIDYWGQSRRYQHSPAGRIRTAIDPLGRKIIYDTNPLGRILKKTLPHPHIPGRSIEEVFEYDANGYIVAAENPHVRIERKYDADGRLIEERQGAHFTLRNSYDECGNRITRRTELKHGASTIAHQTRFGFDAVNQASEIAIDAQSPIRIERNAAGQITAQQLNSSLRREMEYGPAGHMNRKRVRSGSRDIVDVRYRYDAAGNLTERHDAAFGDDRFLYDPYKRITQHIDPQGQIHQYLYDPAGDLLRTQLLQSGPEWSREGEHAGSFYRFDLGGNLIERRDERGQLRLTWDANQRLVASEGYGLTTAYQYDPYGRRISKRTGARETLFAWDMDTLIADSVAENGRDGGAREWVYLPETFQPLAMVSNDSRSSILHYDNDPNGCPTRTFDASGKVQWAASYSALGGINRLHIAEIEQPLRLQGQYEDAETGLAFNRHRYFDARVGSFISPDPLGLAGGENTYLLARNVHQWADPLGLTCENAADLASGRARLAATLEARLAQQMKARLQALVDQAVQDIRTNPSLAADLMSPGSYKHLVDRDGLYGASFGKAVERRTAQLIAEDPEVADLVAWTGKHPKGPDGKFCNSPDFIWDEGGVKYDVTTQTNSAAHNARYADRGESAELLPYNVDNGLTFPASR